MEIKTPRSETAAKQASSRKLLSAGLHPARISEAVEKPSKAGNDMIELTVLVPDAEGNERTLRDWLTDSPLAALKVRHAAEAVGALSKYEAGNIGQEDFAGLDVVVKIGIRKRRGFPDANEILDYSAPGSAGVVTLRAAG
ncbi:MAG: hypothetical protein ACREET_16905 [Stellaceae bacterium]